MLRDRIRNEAYQRAIQQVVKPGQVVLDIGAGTGVLSIMAAQAGARRVFAVERTGVATVARAMIARNGCSEQIEVIEQNVEDVRLPEQVDVIVSEWMGGFGVDENMLAPQVIARERYLRPGGTMIPARVTAHVAPVSIPDFDDDLAYWRSRPHGIDTSVIADFTAHETFHSQTRLTADSLVAPPQPMWTHDSHTCTLEEADRPFTANLTFTATGARTVTALAAWFSAELAPGVELTNAIGAPDTHWGRTLLPLDRPTPVAAGDTIGVVLHCDPSLDGSTEMYWSVTIGGATREFDTRRARHQRALEAKG
jgi:predicted RNA methylase